MADNSIPHDKYAGITHEMLGEARDAWVNRHYPTAKNIGDVVLAQRAGLEPDLTFEQARKTATLERETAEDAALTAELAGFEVLLEAPRPVPVPKSANAETSQRVFKARFHRSIEVVKPL